MTVLWDVLLAHLEPRGFRPYVFNQGQPVQESGEDEEDVDAPLTMLQLLRSGFGVPVSRADYPAHCFWDFQRFDKALGEAWTALDSAARKLDSTKSSAITWAFEPPARTIGDVQRLIEEARAMSPKVKSEHFLVRPISQWMVQPRSLESTVVNLLGIVVKHVDLDYGDFFTQVLDMKGGNRDLLIQLEAKIPAAEWSAAQADSETLLPPLMTRAYSGWLESTNSKPQDKSIVDFLRMLEQQNNLAGNSTPSILQRMLVLVPKGVDGLPATLRNLVLKAVSVK